MELEFDFCVLKHLHKAWTGEDTDPLKTLYKTKRKEAEARVAAGLPAEEPVKEGSNSNSTDSRSWSLIGSVLRYLADYLNHDLPYSTIIESTLGPRLAYGPPKRMSPLAWHVTRDDSLNFSGIYLDLPEMDRKTKKEVYRVVGAELVSGVEDFDDEEIWMAELEQIADVLDPKNKECWAYFRRGGSEALHVHFGIMGQDDTDGIRHWL